MIKGIGLDVTEMDRVATTNRRTSKFVERILTTRELDRWSTLNENRQIEFLAGRFAAKEAFAKALGTGIGKECSFQDIEVLSNQSGKPILYFNGKIVNGHVSITHTKQFAAAQVILLE
ncbi:holo-ACP synthase [Paenisporosarcina indica]|uniref:holo-ACP synthase n=1 Tax=Paenisporosarcina indica TaxID=650093 RepID=UPI00094F9CD9|nr:holo-ACP synthase [Paenisporosarcina indica]